MLPLDATKLKTLAVIGENAIRLQAHGGVEIGWYPGTADAPQWTASFSLSTNGLYGHPASIRGWHYRWNPAGDNLFPRKLSGAPAVEAKRGLAELQ